MWRIVAKNGCNVFALDANSAPPDVDFAACNTDFDAFDCDFAACEQDFGAYDADFVASDANFGNDVAVLY